MVAQQAAQLAGAIRALFVPVADYAGLITQNNPYRSASSLVERPDMEATLQETFETARNMARQAVLTAWAQNAPSSLGADVLLHELLGDVDRAYNSAALDHLRGDIRHAYSSVPLRQFVPGTSPPGSNPVRESVAERSYAVQEAIAGWAARTALRNSLSADVALGDSATLAQIEEAEGQPGRWFKQWRTSKQPPDAHTCYWCKKLNGVTIPLRASFAGHLGGAVDLAGHGHLTHPPHPYRGWLQGPQLHPSCLPGDSLVAVADVTGATSRIFHGELIIVRTLSDKLLRATPNHPVLTDQGWVAAGLLQKGGYVVSARGDEWKGFGDYHDENVPATIQQIAEAFLGSCEVSSAEVPVAAEDFHGDGAGSEVCVVGADRGLLAEANLTLMEHVRQNRFQRAYVSVSLFQRLGRFAAMCCALCSSPNRVMRGCCKLLPPVGTELGHPDEHGLAPVPRFNPCFQQTGSDDSPADVEAFREGLFALPGGVALDQIVSVKRDVVTTHVFNLETKSGWYVGSGVIVHNCRCTLVIVPASSVQQGDGGQEAEPSSPPEGTSATPAGFLAAADIRAMPEGTFQSLLAFLRAAAHELGMVLRRLGRLRRG